MSTKFEVVVRQSASSGDFFIEAPAEILAMKGWNIGDKLLWSLDENNVASIDKLDPARDPSTYDPAMVSIIELMEPEAENVTD